jgi:hypothetical protein
MTTWRTLSNIVLTAGLVAAGCGGGEPERTAQPVAPPTSVPAGTVAVVCSVKWTDGPSGTFACSPTGPGADRVQADKGTFRLEKICVNDKRITSFAVAGAAQPLETKPEGKVHCASFAGTPQLPETCSCVAPPGGDCNPPPKGFVCIAKGHVPLT